MLLTSTFLFLLSNTVIASSLDTLPTELVNIIANNLDLVDTANFRSTSRNVKNSTRNPTQFKEVYKKCGKKMFFDLFSNGYSLFADSLVNKNIFQPEKHVVIYEGLPAPIYLSENECVDALLENFEVIKARFRKLVITVDNHASSIPYLIKIGQIMQRGSKFDTVTVNIQSNWRENILPEIQTVLLAALSLGKTKTLILNVDLELTMELQRYIESSEISELRIKQSQYSLLAHSADIKTFRFLNYMGIPVTQNEMLASMIHITDMSTKNQPLFYERLPLLTNLTISVHHDHHYFRLLLDPNLRLEHLAIKGYKVVVTSTALHDAIIAQFITLKSLSVEIEGNIADWSNELSPFNTIVQKLIVHEEKLKLPYLASYSATELELLNDFERSVHESNQHIFDKYDKSIPVTHLDSLNVVTNLESFEYVGLLKSVELQNELLALLSLNTKLESLTLTKVIDRGHSHHNFVHKPFITFYKALITILQKLPKFRDLRIKIDIFSGRKDAFVHDFADMSKVLFGRGISINGIPVERMVRDLEKFQTSPYEWDIKRKDGFTISIGSSDECKLACY